MNERTGIMRQQLKRQSKNFLLLFVTTFLFSCLGIFAPWINQYNEVSVQVLSLPLVVAGIKSAIFALVYLKLYQKNPFAGLVAALGMVLFTNVDYIARLDFALPFLKAFTPFSISEVAQASFYNELFLGVLFLMMWGVAFLIQRATKKIPQHIETLFRASAIVIIVAVGVQAISMMRIIKNSWNQYWYTPPTRSEAKQNASQAPDIYYIVTDDYTNSEVLKNQLNFDNAPFQEFLIKRKFYVPENFMSSYPSSALAMASTLNLDYNNDLIKKFHGEPYQSNEPYYNAIRYSSLVKQLKSYGYSYHVLGSWYETSTEAPLADSFFNTEGQLTVLGKTWHVGSFARPLIGILKRGFAIGDWNIVSYSAIHTGATPEKLNQLSKLIDEKEGGRFIFAHFLVPHAPYDFLPSGAYAPQRDTNNYGRTVQQKYTDQVQYINAQMQKTIAHIQEKDPSAIIIFLSDEGADPLSLSRELFSTTSHREVAESQSMNAWTNKELEMKFGSMAAFYIPQADQEIVKKHGNPVNVFRIVLNTLFGMHYEYLPSCSYGFEKGTKKPYQFIDVTSRVMPGAIPCNLPGSNKQ